MLEVRHLAAACLVVAAGVSAIAVGCANGDPVDDGVAVDDGDSGSTGPGSSGGSSSSGGGSSGGGGKDGGTGSSGCQTKADCPADQICDTTTHTCVGCAVDGDCPPGKLCDHTSKSCQPGCNPNHACPNGQGCCNNACAPTNTVTSCSGCGLACDTTHSSGASCDGKTCAYTSCSAGFGDCKTAAPNTDGCETAVNTPANCGGCGRACSTNNVQGTPTCTNGSCNSACNPGFGNCSLPVAGPDGGVVDDGCESNLTTCAGTPCCGTLCGKHDNGVGMTYVDCTDPLGKPGTQSTYNANMAGAVIKSFAGANNSGTNGTCFNQYTCAWARNTGTGECMVWCYTGIAAGYMRHTLDNSCGCPENTNDATWN